MPQKPLRWSELIPGALALAAILLIVGAVFRYAKVGQVRGAKATLYAQTGAARGVIAGTTEVWLEGQKIGMVKGVGFRPIQTDTTRRIVLELEVIEEALPYLRRDSFGQIRAGGNLIGAQVVFLHAGTKAAPGLVDGDTLSMHGQGDTESLTSQIAVATKAFPEIMTNAKTIGTQLADARGTAGAVLYDGRATREMERFTGQASGLMERATGGRGTIGLAMRGELGARAGRAMATADSIRTLVTSGGASIGRFRRDSTLLRQVGDARTELAIVQALLAEPRGTAGRVLADSAAQQELGRIRREMDQLFEDIKRNPMRYLAF